ncbi:hypothetical protein A2Z00_04755 [Candidatus Gottesmanbacteria bacterium RBG_13_45_10]|uniref:Uncharacterized protein n=1 Tax=Candidatus Gottesmanbacteria bacterium RBG_13_45_10 TaxID=1798370 RepID=A0A1F5ZFT5_9BACT|nr:MAG: hypothetical protein A2Z00_04755 [Candidatus Gottesmanbacteria bacterium RBG_13_45_10]
MTHPEANDRLQQLHLLHTRRAIPDAKWEMMDVPKKLCAIGRAKRSILGKFEPQLFLGPYGEDHEFSDVESFAFTYQRTLCFVLYRRPANPKSLYAIKVVDEKWRKADIYFLRSHTLMPKVRTLDIGDERERRRKIAQNIPLVKIPLDSLRDGSHRISMEDQAKVLSSVVAALLSVCEPKRQQPKETEE